MYCVEPHFVGHHVALYGMLDVRQSFHQEHYGNGERVPLVKQKVEWSCLIKAKNQGGFGLVDPVHQSKALLGKLLERSLQSEPKLWRLLLRDKVEVWCPRNGGPWKAKSGGC